VTVNQLFDDLLADYALREIKALHHVELRLAEKGKRSKRPKPLRAVFGARRASSVTTADILRYMKARKERDLRTRRSTAKLSCSMEPFAWV
jgi:hypothetical protein